MQMHTHVHTYAHLHTDTETHTNTSQTHVQTHTHQNVQNCLLFCTYDFVHVVVQKEDKETQKKRRQYACVFFAVVSIARC